MRASSPRTSLILRRSRLLVALLVIYPIAIALLIGLAISRSPGKPKVAVVDLTPPGQTVQVGSQRVPVSALRRPAVLAGAAGACRLALAGGRADRIGQGAGGGRDPAEHRRAARHRACARRSSKCSTTETRSSSRSCTRRSNRRSRRRTSASPNRSSGRRRRRSKRCFTGTTSACSARPRTGRPRPDSGEAARRHRAPAARHASARSLEQIAAFASFAAHNLGWRATCCARSASRFTSRRR